MPFTQEDVYEAKSVEDLKRIFAERHVDPEAQTVPALSPLEKMAIFGKFPRFKDIIDSKCKAIRAHQEAVYREWQGAQDGDRRCAQCSVE